MLPRLGSIARPMNLPPGGLDRLRELGQVMIQAGERVGAHLAGVVT